MSTEYQYDVASQLTALIYRNAAGVLGNLTYQYDQAGNRIQVGGSFARTLLPSPVASATYDATNRQRVFGDAQMAFDANGNLTTIIEPGGTSGFTWDARDRLVGVEAPGTVASFEYAFGRRIAKAIDGVPTRFLYDGTDVVQQLEPHGTTGYLRSLAIDEMLGLSGQDGSFFSIADALGSTLAVIDGAGTSLTAYSYDPFGTTTSTPGVANPFQFTGRENDALTGSYYYRARYYAPKLHRFISEDPIALAGGDTNLYSYALNRPTVLTDPSGLEPVTVSIATAVAVVCAVGAVAADAVVLAVNGRKTNAGQLAAGAAVGCVGGVGVLGAYAAVVGAASVEVGVGAVTAGSAAVERGKVVIGENMSRVIDYARRIGAETFKGSGMEANRAWVREQMQRGKEIIDIGPYFLRRLERFRAGRRPDSPFYNMERQETAGYPVTRAWQRAGRLWGSGP